MSSREQRLQEVAEMIDRNRLNEPIRGMTVGQFLAEKLEKEGYLATREEWGIKNFRRDVYLSKSEDEARHASWNTKSDLLFRHSTPWEEVDNEVRPQD